MNNKDWLKDLKKGDKVIEQGTGIGSIDYIREVERVTPSGRIILTTGTTFNPDGRLRGGKSAWGTNRLEQATDKALARVKRDNLLRSTKNLSRSIHSALDNLATADLSKLHHVLRKVADGETLDHVTIDKEDNNEL